MGIDINAKIVVGRPATELDITKFPYYDELEEGESWSLLINDVYYLKKEDRFAKLEFVKTHHDNYEGIVGFCIADSGSWDWAILSPFDLMNDIMNYSNLFGELFGIESKIILIPKYW